MPSKQQHLDKAAHNEAFYDDFDLDSSPYCDWAVTVLFYALLHYVDTFLAVAQKPVHPNRHAVRDGCVARIPDLGPIYNEYITLKDKSRDARYYATQFGACDVRKLQKERFLPAKNHLLSLL